MLQVGGIKINSERIGWKHETLRRKTQEEEGKDRKARRKINRRIKKKCRQ